MCSEAPSPYRDSLSSVERRAFGKTLQLIGLPKVRDVLIQSRKSEVEVWVDEGSGLKKFTEIALSEHELRDLATNLISAGGRHIDELNPCTDVQLGQGIRVHAVLAPIVTSGAAISIRLPSLKTLSIMDLFRSGICDTTTAKILLNAVKTKKNILISGATASGKTTLLTALLSEVNPDERIISIEDVGEIRPNHPHHLALESRQANSEGIGEVNLDMLLREALRMRPDRIVLGECRGKEVVTLLTALNTGHDGGASTLHANSMNDIPARLEALGTLAGLTPQALARQAASAINMAIHVTRVGTRHRIEGIGSLTLNDDGLLTLSPYTSEF
ncbi:MAG TPA: ATPase, T2SS/T4P/T4SS family [Microbacteriaceae bacterium]|nr:ATPase, T2SS/T4P/T4SS family [Microbacteriaceae bacterium]